MKNINALLDFNDFSYIKELVRTKHSLLNMAMKKSSKSKEYIFKTFLYNCASPKDQKIIAQTFSEISSIKNQYIKSYNKCSFSSFEPKFNPTFSMEYISLDTLEKVIKSMDFYTKWSIADIMNCLFAVSEGMLFLHNHLICHGNFKRHR